MKNFDEYLSGLKLPSFVLIKNLKFEHDYDIDAAIARGEVINYNLSFDALRSEIPKPRFPDDDYKTSLLDSKYGQVSEDELEYDDTIFDITEGEPNDYEIFGESYTIVFLSPPEKDNLLKYLRDRYSKERDLVNIWTSYIDRIHIYPFYSLDVTSDQFIEEISEDFQSLVRKLPKPPDEEEWDELNDYL